MVDLIIDKHFFVNVIMGVSTTYMTPDAYVIAGDMWDKHMGVGSTYALPFNEEELDTYIKMLMDMYRQEEIRQVYTKHFGFISSEYEIRLSPFIIFKIRRNLSKIHRKPYSFIKRCTLGLKSGDIRRSLDIMMDFMISFTYLNNYLLIEE